MTNFDWHTEEDEWDESLADAPTATGQRRRLRPTLFIVIGIVLLAAGAIYWQVDRQINDVAESVETDLRASVEIIQRALRLNDLELFRSVLSGRDPAWTQAQRDLFSSGLLFDRPALGLHWRGPPPAAAGNVILEDELDAAILRVPYEFQVRASDGATTTVQLEQTLVFRTGSNRWLLAPPLTEFWGEWQSSEYQHLALSYPARERELARRLGDDLHQLLLDLCAALPELNCDTAPPLSLRFSKSPETLLAVQNLNNYFQEETADIDLPAPTLVGLPLDDTGYNALFRGYARHVAVAAIGRWAGYECCRHGLYLEALVDYLLSEQGTAAWPVTAATYDSLLTSGSSLQQASIAWQVRLTEGNAAALRTVVYASIPFLLEQGSRVTPGRLLATMNDNISHSDWLNVNIEIDPNFGLEPAWYAHIYERSNFQEEPRPVPWPEQDIMLICPTGDDFQEMAFIRYRPETEEVFPFRQVTGAGLALPLPRNQGILLEVWYQDEDRYMYEIYWSDGSQSTVFPGAGIETGMYYLGESDPAGDRLLWLSEVEGTSDNAYSYLDLDQCRDQASCQTVLMDGAPTWSPDGRHTLIRVNSGNPSLWLGNGDGRRLARLATEAYAPFWLDDQRFGYLNSDGVTLLALGEEPGAFTQLRQFTNADIQDSLTPYQIEPTRLTQVSAAPANPNQLIVMAIDNRLGKNLLARYDMVSGRTDSIYSSNSGWYNYSLSDNQEYVLFQEQGVSDSALSSEHTVIINLNDDTVQHFPFSNALMTPANWSVGNDWLVLPVGRVLQLIAPAAGYHTIRSLPTEPECYAGFWVPRLAEFDE